MRSAAILAGGHATRFGGRDKSGLLVEGRTIFDRQVEALSAVPDLQEILVVGSRRLRAGVSSPRSIVRTIDDLVPGSGPLGGIHAALTEARSDAVAVVACDMPYVTAPFVAFLFDLSRDADIVMPRTERGYHPMCAVYTRACLDSISRRLAERRLKAIDLVLDGEDHLRARIVSADEVDRFGPRERLLANVNTPADYTGLEALQDHEQ